ncbi:MAG TPA: HAMP domain-containing sensor histidine kinase [Nocardioides sp.]|nr:HAMP domain-containing sensor histidine kinase [Nocardioides sp.]
MTLTRAGLHRRLVLWAAGLSGAVALVLVAVVNFVIDATADEAVAERVETYATWSTVAAGAVMVVVATGLAAWASKRALEPVGEMARAASEWSEHALDRRFALGPPTDEIRDLGRTLDLLLDKVAQVIRGEQRLTSELAHELRHPLSAIRATADLMSMRPDLDPQMSEDVGEIVAWCEVMSTTISGLLDLARANDRRGSARVEEVVAIALHGRGGVTCGGDQAMVAAVPADLGARALGPVLDNALRLGSQVRVDAARQGQWIELRVSDNGPGVPDELAGSLFDPGVSGGAGSGLGLALARRVARSVGGDVRLEERPSGTGATFVVALPAAG